MMEFAKYHIDSYRGTIVFLNLRRAVRIISNSGSINNYILSDAIKLYLTGGSHPSIIVTDIIDNISENYILLLGPYIED